MTTGHAARVLELDAALSRVAARASGELGRERVLALRPRTDAAWIAEELASVSETAELLRELRVWAPPPLPDARSALRRLAPEGSVLDPAQLYTIGELLAAARLLRNAVLEGTETGVRLQALVQDLHRDPDRESALQEVVDGSGAVLDTASRELRRIREQVGRTRSRIVKQLEQYLSTLSDRYRVADASVSIRNGRYVVPVRREGRRDVGGIVHDESATGATLFIEPPLAIQLMNDLKELERAEAREIQRVLAEQSDALRPDLDALRSTQEGVARFDSLYARARAAIAWEAHVPELLEPRTGELRIVAGRHPLLVERDDLTVVPFDLEMTPDERALVVSGPNTGGKTVFLKALGLTALLTQCGVLPPVGAGTRLPVFNDVFVDIGDEQSIVRSLSTFSAHLANLREIVERAGPTSLVLIDEMGTGTDPTEGAALARAVLEELVARKSLSFVTSHLGALKRLDADGSGIVNASLEFDPDRMEPTYVLVKGRPGRSYGLAIARRLGFSVPVLDRAESHVSEDDARMDETLERLERTEREARERADRLASAESHAQRLSAELEARERALKALEASADERARAAARRMLLEARSEVDAAIRGVQAAESTELSRIGREARRRVELAAAAHDDPGAGPVRTPAAGDLSSGDRVRLRAGGTRARVLEVREDRVVVSAAGIRMSLPRNEIDATGDDPRAEPPDEPRPTSDWQGTEPSIGHEVDLRGLRVDEVQLELARALDAAVLQDSRELRVIHGKGTGAVRKRVQELLRAESRVSGFRLGGHGEGGSGVTVATLR